MLTELIPLALVIALSPLTIIPAVLTLNTPQPRPTSLAFLTGWLAGLAVLTIAFMQLSSLAGGRQDQPPGWASWLRIVVGAGLLVFGFYRWVTRHRSAHMPRWMQGMGNLTPRRAVVTAVALTVVNPKVLFMCVAAGLAIGSAGVHAHAAHAWLGVVWFVAVASSTVAAPILAYAVSGSRLDATLARLREWMERQHAVLIAVILVLIGLMVFYKGIHGLT